MPNCPQKTEVDSVRYADLTGDGLTEAIVAAACWTDTSQNPINVFVYDGTDRRPPLDRLLTIGKDQYLKTRDGTHEGRHHHRDLRGPQRPGTALLPDLKITQKYQWSDGAFHRVLLDEEPLD